jgi:hypothetical protein
MMPDSTVLMPILAIEPVDGGKSLKHKSAP